MLKIPQHVQFAAKTLASLGLALLCALILVVGGCSAAMQPTSSRSVAKVDGKSMVAPTDGKPSYLDRKGRMSGYVESARATDFCPGPASWRPDQRCVVTRGWDYSQGVTLVRTFDPNGVLLSEKIEPGADLSLVSAEQQRVESLLRSDPRLAPIVNKPAVKVWRGGFAFREPGDPYCDRGSRCVHVIAGANDGEDAIAHAIVDLMTDKVVYPFYTPRQQARTTHSEALNP